MDTADSQKRIYTKVQFRWNSWHCHNRHFTSCTLVSWSLQLCLPQIWICDWVFWRSNDGPLRLMPDFTTDTRCSVETPVPCQCKNVFDFHLSTVEVLSRPLRQHNWTTKSVWCATSSTHRCRRKSFSVQHPVHSESRERNVLQKQCALGICKFEKVCQKQNLLRIWGQTKTAVGTKRMTNILGLGTFLVVGREEGFDDNFPPL